MIGSESTRDGAAVAASGVSMLHPFQVPVFKMQLDEPGLNEQLRAAILDHYENSEGIQGSNRGGGWHSRRNLHKWSSPGVNQLLQRIEDLTHEVVRCTVEDPQPPHFDDWLIEAWANVNMKGASNRSHDHFGGTRRTLWSGIYYVEPGNASGKSKGGGRTVFEDRIGMPRDVAGKRDAFSHELSIEPRPGMMVMFPATLRHRVEPYLGENLRITIAWNLFHSGFRVPQYEDSHASSPTIWGSRALWHAGQVMKAMNGVLRRPSVLVRRLIGSKESDANRRGDGSRNENPLLETLEDRETSRLNPRRP